MVGRSIALSPGALFFKEPEDGVFLYIVLLEASPGALDWFE
jgi:hypothetical protein